MQNSLIVRKYAGQVIPDAFFEKVLPIYTSSWGASYLSDDGKIMSASQDNGLEKENFDQMNLHFMDKELVLFFSQAQEIQPYPVITVDGTDHLLAFLEGNFKNKLNPEDTMSNENAIVEKWMKPRIQKIYGFLGGDMAKVRAEIEEDQTLEDFQNVIEGRGNIVLFFPDGAYSIVKENPLIGSYPWGFTTNNLGYTEGMEKVEEPAPVKTGVLDMFKSGVSAVAATVGLSKAPPPPPPKAAAPLAAKPAAAPPPPPAPAAKAPPPPPTNVASFPKGAADAAALAKAKQEGATEVVYYKCNDNVSNSKKKDIYKLAKESLDFVPDWRHCPVVEIPKDRWEKYQKALSADGKLVEFASMAQELKDKFNKPKPGEIKSTTTTADGKVTSETVKTGSVPAAPPPPPVAKDTTVKNFPTLILPLERRGAILAQDMSILDKNSLEMEDPAKLGELVKKYPPLETQLGKDQFWRKWSPESLKQWITKNPDAASIIVFHQNLRLSQFEAASKAVESKNNKAAAGGRK